MRILNIAFDMIRYLMMMTAILTEDDKNCFVSASLISRSLPGINLEKLDYTMDDAAFRTLVKVPPQV